MRSTELGLRGVLMDSGLSDRLSIPKTFFVLKDFVCFFYTENEAITSAVPARLFLTQGCVTL